MRRAFALDVLYPVPLWAFRAGFGAAIANPLPSPMPVEFGQLAFVDGSGNLSQSSDNLVIAACAGVSDPVVSSNIISQRSPGLTLFTQFTPSSATERWIMGWSPNKNINNISGLYFRPANGLDIYDNNVTITNALVEVFATSTAYDVRVLQKLAGVDVFIKGGVFTNWTLLFSTTVNSSDHYGIAGPSTSAAACGTMAYFEAKQLGGAFAQANGLTTVDAVSPSTGTVYTSVADAVHIMPFTLPASPNAGDTITLEYRRQDASNKWLARVVRNGGNTAWDLQVRTVTATVEATPSGWTDQTNVGSVDTLEVITQGNLHTIFTKTTTTWKRQSNQANSSYLNTATDIAAVYAVGSVASLRSKPRTSSLYDVFDAA